MSWARRHPARYEQQPNHGQGYPLLPTGAGNRSHRRKWVYKQRRKFGTELLVVSLYIYLFSIMGTLVPIQLRQVEGAHSTLMGAAANAPSCLGTDGLWQDMTRWKNETRRHPRGWRTASIPLSQPLNSIDFYRQARNSNWPDPPPHASSPRMRSRCGPFCHCWRRLRPPPAHRESWLAPRTSRPTPPHDRRTAWIDCGGHSRSRAPAFHAPSRDVAPAPGSAMRCWTNVGRACVSCYCFPLNGRAPVSAAR